MPINKDLSVSPYFDDFNEDKNYYRVLFKPSVAVQVRELNQLQTILQHQIEKFGNNIYKRGTIIDGCNFLYYPNYSYIKINDSQLDGEPATPSLYVGSFIVDPSSNLTAHVINSIDGFESTDPDLKTLYLRYINSGDDSNTTSFTSGSNLKIYNYLNSINSVVINNGSSGWSNNDTIVFCSALQIDLNSSTPFTVGETITETGNTHVAIITDIVTFEDKTVLKIKPRQSDLSNTAIASTVWQFDSGSDIIGSTSGATATINEIVGDSAAAKLTTSADVGKILEVDITAPGENYYVEPYVSIKSSGTASAIGSRNYADLDLVAHNYIAQVTVSNKSNSVGAGYAFGVTEGVIYQKGYFIGVDPQTIVVSKYSPTPNNVSVGFSTQEETVDSNVDQDLLDNAIGAPNEFAPGADRLKLTPILITDETDAVAANEEFLSLVDFSEGRAFRENRQTQFNAIETEMALRTKESSGDFVLDQFLVTTRSPANSSFEGNTFTVVVDPGHGYINGYRVETIANYYVDVDKGIDTRSAVNLSTTIDYGNFILVTEVAGSWKCNAGDVINLMSSSSGAVSNTAAINSGTLSASGSAIGTARIRNLVYDSGETGTNAAIYRLYLFNIQMNAGQSFKSVNGVQLGSTTAVADTVLTFDATTNSNICLLSDTIQGSSLIVPTGTDATATISNISYVYRQTNETLSLANTGTTSFLLTDPTETFGYESTSLTDTEKRTVTFIPTSADVIFTPNTGADGTAATTSGSNTITISSASVNKYQLGDFIAIYDTSTHVLRRVTSKTATTLRLDSSVSFTNATASFSHAYPKNVPVGLHRITGATVTTSGGGTTLNINLGTAVNTATTTTCSLTYDVKVTGASPQSKTASRDIFVKLDINSDNLNGPWCLGIPDIFRLKNVYLGASSSVNTSSTDVTDQFYIDHNQTADYYGLGYLYRKSDANITLGATSWLLVQFDAFTSTPGVFTLNSYVSSNTAQRFIDDSLPLGSLATKANSFEVPEVFTASGKYFDLLNCIDFRPVATATASYANTSAAANTNPSSTLSFSGSSKKFPLPESGVLFDRDSFLGRKDLVLVNQDEQIKVMRGTPNENPAAPTTPPGVLFLNVVDVPPYPGLPTKFSSIVKTILDKKMANEKFLLQRIKNHTINIEVDASQRALNQPKGYTMADIGHLERRISDLEYNVSLSLVESDLKDKVIPSVASPGLNRFKFGFFVDDYSTTQYSDTENVEYKCEIVDSKVVPMSQSTGTPHGPPDPSTGNCTGDIVLVSQGSASAPATNTTPNTAQITAKFVSIFKSEITTGHALTSDTGWLTFSSVPSTYSVVYNFFSAPDTLTIQKKNANGSISTLFSNNLVRTGTLNFSHDPSTGNQYLLRVNRLSPHWQYTLTYPIDSTVYVDPSVPSTNLSSTFYDGTLISISPGTFTTQKMHQNFGETAYCSLGITQTIQVASLKPSTVHTLTIGGSQTSIFAKPIITVGTGVLSNNATVTTDQFGSATFKMRIDNTLLDSIASIASAPIYKNVVPSTLYAVLASGDGTSVLNFIIKIETGNPLQPIVNLTGVSQTLPLSSANTAGSFGSPVILPGRINRTFSV